MLTKITPFICVVLLLLYMYRPYFDREDIRRIGVACAAFGKLDKMWIAKSIAYHSILK